MLDILVLWGAKAVALLGVVIPFAPRRLPTAKQTVVSSTAVRSTSPRADIRVPSLSLTPGQHFDRVGAVITQALRSSQLAAEMHNTARQHLEVVEFSIDRILDDVAEVMSLTPELKALRKPVAALVPLHRRAA
jgi:hypothetical protein